MREENFTRRTELDYINAAACLCVILIHVLSYGIGGYGPQSWQAAVIYFPWRLAGFVVPAFLFTGAVKMALFFGDRKITAGVYLHYIWERILHIYFPYVIWAAVYYLYLYSAGYMQGSFSELTAGIFWGSLSGQFYYIVIVMQFYLLMPLWIRLVRRVPFFVSLCVSIFLTMIALRFSNFLRLFDFSFAYADRMFLPYLVFWILGIYAGAHYDRMTESIRRIGAGTGAVFCLCVLSGTLLAYGNYSRGILLIDQDFLKLVTDIMSILLIWAVCIRIRGKKRRTGKLLAKINRASYQVYLSHCLFLTAVTDVLAGYAVSTLLILTVRAIIGYTVPFLLYAGWEKVKSCIRR